MMMEMDPNSIIAVKDSGRPIPKDQLRSLISGYVEGAISDATMTRFLQAIYDRGMEKDEIYTLVEVMIGSGITMDFSHVDGYVADKHSIGGVGDKISLILTPLLAAAGLYIPMIAGRSLGHTGGTIDKLETIPGFSTEVSVKEFQKMVSQIGCGMMSQSDEICPADGKIYALRDVTGTIASVALICGSIMSKKIAEGIGGLVLDIKIGNGSFMGTLSKGKELGTMLKDVGEHFGVSTDLVFSNMDQPLGRFSGMWCEVQEATNCLHGKGPADTMEVTMKLASKLLIQSNPSLSEEKSHEILIDLIQNGSALEKFHQFIESQGGNLDEANNEPRYKTDIRAKEDGIIQSMDTTSIGWGLTDIGCGRRHKNDILDSTAGLECLKKIGETVREGDVIFQCFCNDEGKLNTGVEQFSNSISIGPDTVTIDLFYD